MEPGLRVRCLRTGRRGVIAEIIDPPRGRRNIYVVWGGSLDFSLMAADEVEADLDTTGAGGRGTSHPETDWRTLLVDTDLHLPDGDAG